MFTADSFETFYKRLKNIAVKNDWIYPDKEMGESLLKKAWKYYDKIYQDFIN